MFGLALVVTGCGQTPLAQPSPSSTMPESTPTSLPRANPTPQSQATADIGGPRPIPTTDMAPGAVPTGGMITGPTVGTSVPGGPVEGPPLSQIGTPTPHPTLMPGADGVVVVKSADRPSAAVMSVGNTLRLELEEFYDWQVGVSDPTILAPQPARWVYLAASPGTTTVELQGDPKCLSATPPCGAPSIGFTVTVTVK